MKEKKIRLLNEAVQGLEYAQKQALQIMNKLERFRKDIANIETSPTWAKIFAEVRQEIETTPIIKDDLVFRGASSETGKPDPVCLEMAVMRIQNLLYLHYNSRMEKKANKINSYLLEMQGISQELGAHSASEDSRNASRLSLKEGMEKIKKTQRVLRIARGELSVFLLMAKAQQEPVPTANKQ